MSKSFILVLCIMFACSGLSARTNLCQPPPSHGLPRIEISPNPAFLDQPVTILLRNFPARQFVAVQLLTTNLLGQPCQSYAQFLTDRHGDADLATQAPDSGTYRHADPGGLFWSLSRAGSNTTALRFTRQKLDPMRFKLAASVNGRTLATATLERFLLRPGVRQIQVRDHGLRGTLFLPAGKGSRPGVIVLGGSEGGLPDTLAAYLAAKGYAAFALAYFRYEDLPKYLENIPLEYFQTAIHWLQARHDIRRSNIAVLGASRGGELALLLGATFPEIRAVVAISPSSVLWGGLAANARADPAWTWRGKPLPFMESLLTREQWEKNDRLLKANPFDNVLWFQVQLENQAAVAKASIPVGKINGPVLLISGNDDTLWPSTPMADMVMERLKQARHPFPDRHLAYPGAGHFIPFPNMSATMNVVVHPVSKEKLALGGDPEDTAAASADAWPRIVDFLNQSLHLHRHD